MITGAIIHGNKDLVTIHEPVGFGGDVLLYANATIEIGEYSILGCRTMLHTSTHDYHDHPSWAKRIDRPIKIGKHVWIGAGVIILAGVIIEDFAVIGAGTVVNANIPQGAIVVGNPARIVKMRNPADYNKEQSMFVLQEGVPTPMGFLTKRLSEYL